MKGIVLLGCLALIYAVIKWAIIAPIFNLYHVMITESVKPEPVGTTSPEYVGHYIVEFVSNYTFNLRNCTFPYYANLTLPVLGNVGYS